MVNIPAFVIFVKMKKRIKIFLISISILIIVVAGGLLTLNLYIMPWYVDAVEVELPDLVGLNKTEAIRILDSLSLKPILEGPRYDARFDVDEVMFQNPPAGKTVKENRRVYLHISGGEPLVKMPNLRQKTHRDARINLERIGLHIRDLEQVKSEFPSGIIIDQEFEEGTYLAKGDSVSLQISIGPRRGMIETPYIIGRSLKDAERILRRNSLNIGELKYEDSPLLTNTVIDQYPSEGFLLNVGDSVDVWVARSK